MEDYQRATALIDLDAIASNLEGVKEIARAGNSKIMAVVKADAYGHGAVQVSRLLLKNGVDSLSTAIFEEAVLLREHGITADILVLGYTPFALLDEIVKYGLTQTVFHTSLARELSHIGLKHNKKVKVHIKVDTGMSRLGFMPDENGVKEIEEIMGLDGLFVEGIYTHFATSDDPSSDFAYEQERRFRYLLDELEKRNIHIPIKHTSNSGAIINNSDICYDAIRPGIILYGLPPANFAETGSLRLKPAMTFKSRISYIKPLSANVSIGYGRSFFTERESIIATVPVGYADGYSRVLSNKARVIVGGEYADVVGNICMDQLMIDITHIKNVKADDPVILMGESQGLYVSADELAQMQGTINYEVLCSVGKRVPRAYVKDGEITKFLVF